MLKHCISTRSGVSAAVRLLTTRNSKALLLSKKFRISSGISHAIVRPFGSKQDEETLPLEQEHPEEDAAIEEIAAADLETLEQINVSEGEAEEVLEQGKAASDPEQKPRRQKIHHMNADTYKHYVRVQDQLSQLKELQNVSAKRDKVLKIDVESLKANLKSELEAEKSNYLKSLEAQEALLKSDTSRRVFSVIEELESVQAQETQLMSELVKDKRIGSDFQGSKKELKEKETKRREILIKYSQLKTSYFNQDSHHSISNRFDQLPEDQQRNIFKVLKINHSREIALAELSKYDATADLGQIKMHQENADNIQEMLKQILPKYFKEEYMSLKQIQDQKQQVDQIFQKAEDSQLKKLEQIQEVQTSLGKIEKELTPMAVRNQIADLLLNQHKAQKVQNFEGFEANRKVIENIQSALRKLPAEDVTEREREVEFRNQQSRSSYKYDQRQTENLLRLVTNSPADFFNELNINQKELTYRQKQIEDPEQDPDLVFHLEGQEDREIERLDLPMLLMKYKVDPEWVRNKQTEQLAALVEEFQTEMRVRSQILAQDFVSKESKAINSIIQQQTFKKEQAQEQLLSRFRIFAHANDIVDDKLIKSSMSHIQNLLNDNKGIPELDNEYQTSQALFSKVSPPSKSIFDAKSNENLNSFTPRRVTDILTYNEYRINQIKSLKEESFRREEGIVPDPHKVSREATLLIEQMTAAKRNAWLQIYNDFQDFKRRQNAAREISEFDTPAQLPGDRRYAMVRSNEDFYELFRDWEVRNLNIKNPSKNMKRYLQSYGEVSVDQDGNRRVNAGVDMKAVAKEIQDNADATLKKITERETEIGGRFIEDLQIESVQQQENRDRIAQVQANFDRVVAEIEAERGAKSTDPNAFSQEEIQIYVATAKLIEDARKEYKAQFGEDVIDDSMFTVFDAEFLCPQSESVNKQGKTFTKVRDQVELMDDALVRSIEAHLSGVPRLSEEYGIDAEFANEQKGRETQVFDQDNYENFKVAEKIDNMSPHQRQQELLVRRQIEKYNLDREIERQEVQMLEQAQANLEIGKDFPMGPDLYAKLQENHSLQGRPQEAFDRVVKNIGKDAAKNRSQSELLEKRIDDENASYAQVYKGENFADANKNPRYAFEMSAENQALSSMAQKFQTFDFNQFSSLQTNFSTGTPIALKEKYEQAQSSSQIEEVAGAQTLSPEDQQIRNIIRFDDKVQQAYLQAKYQMFINEQTKTQLAVKILNARDMLNTVREKYNQLLKSEVEHSAQFSGAVPVNKHFDFMRFNANLRDPVNKARAITNRLEKFNPNSLNIENYNEELRLQLNLLETLREGQKPNLKQIKYILSQMKENEVQPDQDTYALLFGISLETKNIEEANIYLKKMQGGQSPIAKTRLEAFFNESVARDNFDGLAYLASYLETHNVNIENWNLQRFRSALSFYLNQQFNLNKILTFLRFYTHQAKSVIEGVDAALTEQEAFNKVFGGLESLVDLNALFSHLVEVVGKKTFIDPVTKQDPILQLIEFFTRSDVQNLCKLSKEGTTFISNGDIAKYLANHFTEPRSFNQVSKVVLALDSSPHGNDLLVMQILSGLSDYQARNGQLPSSFTAENIRKTYLEVKAAGQKISEKTAEFMLYLFKSRGLHAETIDLCDNFHLVVRGFESEEAASRSDIRSYYLSECLLSHPDVQGGTYNLIQKAVFADRKDGASYVSSMVKAHLKDGSIDHALKFFEEQIQKRRVIKENEEKELLQLFNSTFGSSSSQIDLNEFKDKYLEIMMVREQTRKELHAVARLEKILHNCDMNELDALFLLQIIISEEKQLISGLCSPDNYLVISSQVSAAKTTEDIAKVLRPLTSQNVDRIAEELSTIKSRKHALEQMIQNENREHMLELIQVMQDGQVMIFGKVASLDEALSQLGMTQQDYHQLLSFHENSTAYSDVIKELRMEKGMGSDGGKSNSDEIMKSFNTTVMKLVEKRLEMHERYIEEKKERMPFGIAYNHIADFEYFTGIRSLDLIQINRIQQFQSSHLHALKRYRSYLYDEPFNKLDNLKKGLERDEEREQEADDDSQYSFEQLQRIYEEPESVISYAYSELIGETADEVASAYEIRKKISLSKMIESFNRVQNIQFKKFGLEKNPDTFSRSEIEAIKDQTMIEVKPGKNVLEAASKGGIDLSQIRKENGNLVIDSQVAKELDRIKLEKGYKLEDDVDIDHVLDEFNSLLSDSHSPVISNFLHLMNYQNGNDMMPIDDFFDKLRAGQNPIDEYQAHSEVLEKQIDRVDQVMAGLHDAMNRVSEKSFEVRTKDKQLDKFYKEWSQQKSKADNLLKEHVETLHKRFNDLIAMRQAKLDFTGGAAIQTLSDNDKLLIMQRVLAMESGNFQPFQIFNSFYSEDLLMFGVKNNIPEAVRLGEKMLNENGTALTPEVARAVKLWKMDHNQQYGEAIKRTGAIDYDKVYRTTQKSGSDGWNRDSVVNLDDPYWKDFFAKNYRAQDQYKLPSAYTWNHRPDGILGEILDTKKVYESIQRNSTFI